MTILCVTKNETEKNTISLFVKHEKTMKIKSPLFKQLQ